MKKIIIIIFIIILGSGFFLIYKPKINNKNIYKEKTKINSKTEEDNKKIKESTIEVLRKKSSLEGLIEDGDKYSEESNYMAAIITYERALKEIPNDEDLNKKIGDIYYEIKNFKKSYKYYKKIKNSKKLDKDKLVKSLINSNGIKKENINNLKTKINSFPISKEKKDYYKISIDCAINYSKCRDEFEKYFEKNNYIGDNNLRNIKISLENFKNFQSKDLYYKGAFLSGAFYENAFYYISLETAKEVLKEKPDYKPMLKVAAKSAYEIGSYEKAKDFLLKNKDIDSHDPEISYFLARIYEKLNDKMLSIIHYEKAVKDGYKNKADIHRRLIFIYFERKNNEKMLKEFDKLLKLKKEELNKTDFSLAIYYSIKNNNLETAKKYSRKAKNYFPKSEIFYGYFAWILLQKNVLTNMDLNIIDSNIEEGLKINKNSAFLVMVKGIYRFKNKNYDEAIVYLKKAYAIDKSYEYREEIQKLIDEVVKTKK